MFEGTYRSIPIERIDDQTFQGYSAVLNLFLRWENGSLGWYDPATGRHILRSSDYREQVEAERVARLSAESRAETAEVRVRELEAKLEGHSQG